VSGRDGYPVLDIRIYGDPVLRRPAEEIGEVDAEVRRLAEEMTRTMRAAAGVGLAGPQVGESRRIAVLLPMSDYDDRSVEPLVLIDPVIEETSGGDSSLEEGCLSIPGIQEPVRRPAEVTYSYTDLENRRRTATAAGLAAHIVQHEIDHLDGVLFIDRISTVRRTLLKKKLAEIKRRSAEARATRPAARPPAQGEGPGR
jgi:peptide deformylase